MEIIKRNIFSDFVLINYLLIVVLFLYMNLELYIKIGYILIFCFCCYYVVFDV